MPKRVLYIDIYYPFSADRSFFTLLSTKDIIKNNEGGKNGAKKR